MDLRFEWDENKAKANLSKHSISFVEASTVFKDLNSITIPDPVHSISEDRFVILGHSYTRKLIIVVFTERERISESLARVGPVETKDKPMKKPSKSNGNILPEYDFAGGVRGKYAKRCAKGSNVVVLDPDVAKIFSSSESVNRSLRNLAKALAYLK